MADSWRQREADGRGAPLAASRVPRRAGPAGGQVSPAVAILLSLISWPEPEVPKFLRPWLVLAAAALWLGVMALATALAPPPGTWPVLPIGLALLVCGFVGGSVIAMLTAAAYGLVVYLGFIHLNLPEATREMVASGYKHRDAVMLFIFAWLCGVPHWRRRFSWLFTCCWGLTIVFLPIGFILVSIYIFYGRLPEFMTERFLNRDFLLAWGGTVIAAAVAAKLLYMAKDTLRRACS